jgi:N-acetyl sugar amidotransferase
MKECSRCLLPETHEAIFFDQDGVCSVCLNREKRNTIDWEVRKQSLIRIVTEVKDKSDYDCIVPFSGGKDSTFTLYYIVRELGLKPLVVSFDHGFYRPNMIENRNRVIELLGVDFLNFRPNWNLVKRLMLQSLLEKGDFCWHCHTGIFSYPMWVAIEKQIPLIIWGEPSSEYTSYYSYDEDEEVDEKRFNQIVNLGITADDMIERLGEGFTARDFKPFTYPPVEKLRQLRFRSVPLGSFIPWDVKIQSSLIVRELGWKGDEVEGVPESHNYEKIECYMQGVRDYIKYLKRGYSRVTHLMTLDIRNGRIDRESAKKVVAEYEGYRPATLDLFLSFVGITEAEFNEIVMQHRIDPWKGAVPVRIGKKPHDYGLWQSKPGLPSVESERIIKRFKEGDWSDT